MALPDDTSTHMTEAEYLAFDRTSDLKHEYTAGGVFAMSGASLNHNLIVGNTITALNNQLADSPCLVSPSDIRVKIDAAKAYRYPDIAVICDEPWMLDANGDVLLNPVVLIEVLSPSTALIDRNDKLREYRQIESLQEYLLISQDMPRVERYLRQDAGNWLYTEVSGIENAVELPSLGCYLHLSDLYKKVTFKTE